MDQVNFVGVKLAKRSILKFPLIRNYKILLNAAVLPRTLLDSFRLDYVSFPRRGGGGGIMYHPVGNYFISHFTCALTAFLRLKLNNPKIEKMPFYRGKTILDKYWQLKLLNSSYKNTHFH